MSEVIFFSEEAYKILQQEATKILSVDSTLTERGDRYGSFEEHARITQALKDVHYTGKNWQNLPPNMKEALDMIAHKIGRILNGDIYYADSWHDIAGYATLIDKELNNEIK